jgi:ubiquinone biosynthesis protein UbiJ
MTTRDLALAGIEQALNTVIGLDAAAADKIARLHGRVIAIRVTGIGLELFFVPGPDGRLQLLGSLEGEPDCRLSGSPLDLMRSGDKTQGPAQLFAGRVTIDGDIELAQRFGGILAGLDIDWEEQLSRLTGDVFAHELGTAVRRTARWGQRTSEVLGQNLAEYLTEEAQLTPPRWEVQDFLDQVDTLRDDLARLEARVARLAAKDKEA